jgi:hypothetical protein
MARASRCLMIRRIASEASAASAPNNFKLNLNLIYHCFKFPIRELTVPVPLAVL